MRITSGLIIIICYWCISCTPVSQSSVNSESNPKVLRLTDWSYEWAIKTVRLYPQGNPLAPAVTPFGQWNLMLDFDDLRSDRDTYHAKIIHCNYDWSKSDLQDLDFMTTYNEFPINNSEFSVDTHLPYVHYWLEVPEVKLPGNYVLAVYRGSNQNDIVLTKRFMVYASQITFTSNDNLVGAGSVANLSQQLNFTINYKNVNILNPLLDVKVNIRQNQRWDNLASSVNPSFVREIEKELEYRFFDAENMFKGGNEFRFFDLRSLNNPGINVGHVNRTIKPFDAYIARDKSRGDEVYSQYNDLNGGYIIENFDYRDLAFTNYANVVFSLSSPPLAGNVYVIGGFNQWNIGPDNLLKYDSAAGVYSGYFLLKQGWYNYQYLVKSPSLPDYHLEGSYFQTENMYEVFVYHRPFQPRADLLIGYIKIDRNAR